MQTISVQASLEQLKLSNTPKHQALATLIDEINNNNITLYYNGQHRAVQDNTPPEEHFLSDGELKGLFLANGNPEYPSGAYKLKPTASRLDQHNQYAFSFYEFIFDGKTYYCCDEDGMYVEFATANIEDAYFIQSDVDNLKKSLSQRSNHVQAPRAAQLQGVEKALALLAREYAEVKQGKFRTGNKVNARSFKDHIISLAKKHSISDAHLKSLDDKLNKTLNDLDLKEL
ncbi:hypothetical protein [uncultured Pseudoteredinibacter sp.]|uniref:hypothetical protein n=1 Tax=uncultured Pseudoteredinibacter sp. TaxID=1641701 RepID=UPI0026255637|nr:hypothetical protein [uncultured Pseudoteredinibacter sp.]